MRKFLDNFKCIERLFSCGLYAVLGTALIFIFGAFSSAKPKLGGDVCYGDTPWCNELRQLCALNGCSGNEGDWYDNRDGWHTELPARESDHPGVQVMQTGRSIQTLPPTDPQLAGKVVIGNASLAFVDGPNWRSLGREIMLTPSHSYRSYEHYINNIHYWFPCHLDHPPYADYYHGMLPTSTNSQGSSGSEMYEIKKWFFALAAFRPEIKEALKSNGLIMPTLQMLARRSRVPNDESYLSEWAHPSAFEFNYDMLTMMRMANAMTLETIPPMAKLRLIADNFDQNYRQHFDSGSERLYANPTSIAYVKKEFERTNWIHVSAADSFDINQAPLSYEWRVLRGDPASVRFNPVNKEGSEMLIEVDYPEERIYDASARESNMTVIGVFVKNKFSYSAPTFITVAKLPEERLYDEDAGQPLMITQRDEYLIHPNVAKRKDWALEYFPGDPTNPSGWIRVDPLGNENEFTNFGYWVAEKDEQGITWVQQVIYDVVDPAVSRLGWRTFGEFFPYDNEPPTSSILEPQEGAVVSGTTPIYAEAQDNIGVFIVSYLLDNEPLGQTFQKPHTLMWNSQLYPNGEYQLRVRVFDRYGNNAYSKPVQITIAN